MAYPSTTTGAASSALTNTDASLPSFVRPEVLAATPDLVLVHDLLSGTRRMWEQSNQVPYIRKWKDEQNDVYDIRRQCETVFEGLGRTLSAATGMLFAKDPEITWNASETAMTDQWPNLDGAGNSGPVVVKRFAEGALRDGFGVIVVDHPSAPIDPETKQPIQITDANAIEYGLRPTWALYARSAIINWRTATINNKKQLTMIVFHESADVETGTYGITRVHRYRVLRLVLTPDGYQATWTLYELTGDDATKPESYLLRDSGVYRGEGKKGTVADFLPVAIGYTGRTDAPMCATIPLLGVAWANLAHWQISTDLRFYRMLSAFPQPTIIGELAQESDGKGGSNPGKLRIGPLVVVHLNPSQNGEASFGWTELSGTSMVQLEQGIQEKLKQMSQLGMSFLTTDTRAAETAEAKRLDSVAENSTLATAAVGISDAVTMALEFHAWYLGIEKAGAPVLSLNTDFGNTVMDAALMQAYGALVKEGFPKRLVLEAMQEGGRIKPDADLDELERDWDAGLAAADAAAKAQAQDQATMALSGAKPKKPSAVDVHRDEKGNITRLVPAA